MEETGWSIEFNLILLDKIYEIEALIKVHVIDTLYKKSTKKMLYIFSFTMAFLNSDIFVNFNVTKLGQNILQNEL